MTNKFFTFLVIIILLLFTEQALATTNFSFTPNKINVQQGQEFSLKIDIDPQGVKNYTVKANIKFPPELVTLKTWTYTNNWMPLRQSGYDYSNSTSGILIRTAGYPEGFDETIRFGLAVFVAKKIGTGVIEFTDDSISLDENSNNMYIGGNKAVIVVDSLSHTIPEDTSVENPPITQEIINPTDGEIVEQLFDINFTVESPVINNSSDLIASTEFFSFGTVPTSVSMAYRIEDIDGKVVYTEKNEITVETEKLVTKKFKGLNLIEGKYDLILTTIYGDNIKDDFRQKFEIEEVPTQMSIKSIWVIILIIIFCLSIYIIYLLKKRKKEKKYEKFFK